MKSTTNKLVVVVTLTSSSITTCMSFIAVARLSRFWPNGLPMPFILASNVSLPPNLKYGKEFSYNDLSSSMNTLGGSLSSMDFDSRNESINFIKWMSSLKHVCDKNNISAPMRVMRFSDLLEYDIAPHMLPYHKFVAIQSADHKWANTPGDTW